MAHMAKGLGNELQNTPCKISKFIAADIFAVVKYKDHKSRNSAALKGHKRF